MQENHRHVSFNLIFGYVNANSAPSRCNAWAIPKAIDNLMQRLQLKSVCLPIVLVPCEFHSIKFNCIMPSLEHFRNCIMRLFFSKSKMLLITGLNLRHLMSFSTAVQPTKFDPFVSFVPNLVVHKANWLVCCVYGARYRVDSTTASYLDSRFLKPNVMHLRLHNCM